MNEQKISVLNNGLGALPAFCVGYRRQQDALLLIRLLNQLIKVVQRHRGMSMSLLAGSNLFRDEFNVLQGQVERRLSVLEAFSEQTGDILSEGDKSNLHNAWYTIRGDWQDDDVIDNFELHSHFIEQLQSMMSSLSKLIEQPALSLLTNDAVLEGDGEHPRMFKRIELLDFSIIQMPAMIEHIAKIRGLAIYATGRGECDSHHGSKLRYAMECVKSLNQKVRYQAERLEEILDGDHGSLLKIKAYDIKLTFLLNAVDLDVLSGSSASSGSSGLFKLATELIDVYLSVIDESIRLVERWHCDDLDAWLSMD